jgi:hypothetical protein
MMTVNQAIERVQCDWDIMCPSKQKQAADALMNEVIWLQLQLAAIQDIVTNGVTLQALEQARSKTP